MNNNNPYTELVVRYLEDEMSVEERKSFDTEVGTNDILKKEFENQKTMNALLDNSDLHSFYETITNIEEEIETEERKRKRRTFIWYASAASIIFILSFTFMLPIMRKPSGSILYAENYEMASSIISDRSVSEKLLPMEKGLLAYDNKNFSLSTEILGDYLQTEPDNMTAQFFLALSYMELEQTEKAIVKLKELIEQESMVYTDQSEWYLSLCYLKTDNIKDAKLMLEMIAGKNHYQKEKAKTILKKLD